MSKNISIKSEKRFIVFNQNFKKFFDDKFKASEISSKLGVSKETVYAWKRGDQLPNGISLKKMREFFDISIDWLLTGHETQMDSSQQEHTIIENKYLKDIMTLNEKLNENLEQENEKLKQEVKIIKEGSQDLIKKCANCRRRGDAEDLDVAALRKYPKEEI